MNPRRSGILLHPTSLPGPYGIGTLGEPAYCFVDFLERAGQSLWQILPLGPTGLGNSPYQCFSSRAGNPLLIDVDLLIEAGLLEKETLPHSKITNPGTVDYVAVSSWKHSVLRMAEVQFRKAKGPLTNDYTHFCEQNKAWLGEYGLFMALKEKFHGKSWQHWDREYRMCEPRALETAEEELSASIAFHHFCQFLFFRQWDLVKEYANSRGIRIIGDLPIYMAMDSADTWAHPEFFQLNEEKKPLAVGGVPPDYFSKTGQHWGNPLYNWEALQKEGFYWWIERLRANLRLFDVLRLDHFRGFSGYWSIPSGEITAMHGIWERGPGASFFHAVEQVLGKLPVIAEDLGVITPDVVALREQFHFPGMKILQFAFDTDGDNDYLPHNFIRNCVAYSGTHDNDTVTGWFAKLPAVTKKYVLGYLHSDGSEIAMDFIRLAWSSVADTAIVTMQDLLGLDSEARMNFPGSTTGNWQWRMPDGVVHDALADTLLHLTLLYGRYNKS